MPVVLLVFGVVIGMAVVNDKIGKLGDLVKSAVFPPEGHGFLIWVFAVLAIASVLRMLDLPEAGKALVVLVVVAYLLGHNDIPKQIYDGINAVKGVPSDQPKGA
jgi:hypothetical protein